jgi:hypothetical protein
MNSSRVLSRFFKNASMHALLLYFISAAIPAMAQNPPAKAKSVITIDGALEPDRIPDWILWRELFNVAAYFADNSPTSGRDFWIDRLGLSTAQMNHLIARARSFRDEEKQIDRDAKAIIDAAGRTPSNPIKSRLHQIQADKESRILAIRDTLRGQIGAAAFQKLQSFARLNIAPTVKVGTLSANR